VGRLLEEEIQNQQKNEKRVAHCVDHDDEQALHKIRHCRQDRQETTTTSVRVRTNADSGRWQQRQQQRQFSPGN
jgi:hypothetical protein